ncbi:hypothetical protein EVAR_3845_1 [Eumeta japonica]|uniref:Uncharacterized protein n=1 Tax=Eumeta variegata TaxID=151549 RepID=A0A4C1SRB3_EUMVA|nr:hypothetical protein EVAR_3845_1 [Eumeta japonica]
MKASEQINDGASTTAAGATEAIQGDDAITIRLELSAPCGPALKRLYNHRFIGGGGRKLKITLPLEKKISAPAAPKRTEEFERQTLHAGPLWRAVFVLIERCLFEHFAAFFPVVQSSQTNGPEYSVRIRVSNLTSRCSDDSDEPVSAAYTRRFPCSSDS